MTEAISLKNTFKTPMFNLFVVIEVRGTGWSKTVAGKVQNTIVVPRIDKTEEPFEGIAI